jgi:hypothetical protein
MDQAIRTERAIIAGSQLTLRRWGYASPLIKIRLGELKEMENQTQNEEQKPATFKPCGWMNMAKSGKCLTLSIGPQGSYKRYTVFKEDVMDLLNARKKGIRVSEVIKTI